MSNYPAPNDRDYDLWLKIAEGWYEYAVNFGAVGLNAPSAYDHVNVLLKKTAYYQAVLIDLLHP